MGSPKKAATLGLETRATDAGENTTFFDFASKNLSSLTKSQLVPFLNGMLIHFTRNKFT